MPPIQLTDEQAAAVQQAAPSLNPQAAPSNLPGGAPALPASAPDSSTLGLPPTAAQPSLPTSAAPAQPAAPATGLGATPAPQTFAQKLAASLNRNAAANGAPGGWAKSLVGGAVDAISTGMGDAATGMKENPLKPGQSGALAGVMNTLAARQQRIGAEKQQSFDNAQKLRQEDREDQRANLENALTTLKTVQTQQQMSREQQKSDEEDRTAVDNHIAAGKAAASSFYNHHKVLGEGITQTDLMASATKGGLYDPQTSIAYQTGETEVFRNGKQVTVPTFTIFQRDAQKVQVSPEQANLLKQYGQPVEAGTDVNGDLLDSLLTHAVAAQATANTLKNAEDEAQIKYMNDEKSLQDKKDLATLTGHLGSDPITDLQTLSKQVGPDGKFTDVAMAASRRLAGYDPKELEQHRHDVEEERQKAADKANENNKGGYTEETIETTDAQGNTHKVTRRVPNQNNSGNNAGGNNPNPTATEFTDNGVTYHIPAGQEQDFLKAHPTAKQNGTVANRAPNENNNSGNGNQPQGPVTIPQLQANRDQVQKQITELQNTSVKSAGMIFDPATNQNVPSVSVNGKIMPKAKYDAMLQAQLPALQQQLSVLNAQLSKALVQQPTGSR